MRYLVIFGALAGSMAMPALAQQHLPPRVIHGPGPGPGPGPGDGPGPAPNGMRPARAAPADIVAAIRKAIDANYVIASLRAPLDAALDKGLASGRYAIDDPQDLARRVTDDLFAVARDRHLALHFQPEIAAQLASGPQDDDAEDSPFFKAMARAHNHGVIEMKVLPGNIRLVTYEGFVWTGPESGAAIDAAMAFLRGGDAAILDLRRNGGGSPDAVRRITSYFVPAGTPLVTFHLRSDKPDLSISEAVPGGPMTMPVYVLTSGRTASAAEEFSSHVARLKFATLVGETTAGAANRNATYPVPGGFVMSVSIGYPELPGGGNWEGKGVAPALAVPQEAALDRALQDVSLKLAAKADGPERTELEWAAAYHAARVSPVKARLALAAYAGRYGVRTVTLEGDALVFQRDGGPRTTMTPVEPDLFALDMDPRMRLRFSGEGPAMTMAVERSDGTSMIQPRS